MPKNDNPASTPEVRPLVTEDRWWRPLWIWVVVDAVELLTHMWHSLGQPCAIRIRV